MSQNTTLYVLIAPPGQLCGNGQLRETISERRNRKGNDVAFWYLSPELVKQLNITNSVAEAVIADDLTAINWLKLRFGGDLQTIDMSKDFLKTEAMDLPPKGSLRDISTSD